MAEAKSGDTVKVHYTGTLDDGSVFDSSKGRDPLEFTVGAGQVIPGFDEAVSGMNPGESKKVKIEADSAYGQRNEELVQKVERSALPDDMELEVGVRLQAAQPDGRTMILTVVELTDDSVTLDANHPLAGEALSFEIELVEIAA